MSYPVIAVEQPAGTFYLTAIPAQDVVRMSRANPRVFDQQTLTSGGGVQRDPSARRIKAITEYADSSDAAFPTILLLAIESKNCTLEDQRISIDGENVADVVDGQHRILGLSKA